MANGTAYLVGAGEFTRRGFHPKAGDAVIAADGGADSLENAGFRPHLVLGDMDSLQRAHPGSARLRFPRQKDLTDLALAIRLAQARGFTRFKLYGALGGRLDHSLANLQLLAGLAQKGYRGAIVTPGLTAFCVADGRLSLPPLPAGRLMSVFAWGGPASGVTLGGLKYPLSGARLRPEEPLGVSNEALGGPVSAEVLQGTLLVTVLEGTVQEKRRTSPATASDSSFSRRSMSISSASCARVRTRLCRGESIL